MKATFTGGRNIAMKVPPHQHDATIAFYRDVLGLTCVEDHASDEIYFDFGSNRLWIDKVPGLSQAEIWLEVVTNDPAKAAELLNAKNVIRCDEIEPLPDGSNRFWIMNPASVVHLVGPKDETQT